MSSASDQAKILQSFRFAGASTGAVKSLSGFKKSHHTLPDAVNAATTAFLAKLAAQEIAEEAESFFQRIRVALAYKRKDLSLDLGPGSAVLTAKDFVFEINYSLIETEPETFQITRALHSIRRADFLLLPECDRLFAGVFHQVIFALTKGAPVEQVIDAVEALNESTLEVSYPSGYEFCRLTLEGVAAEVRFDGSELAMIFPRMGTPRELWQSFLALRSAFALTKNKVINGLVGA